MNKADLVKAISLEPKEAVAFLRDKGANLRPTFDWRDMWQEAHATAFTVAKSAGYDILSDIHGALSKAISEGQTLAQFSRDLTPILQSKGWWGRRQVMDPATGEIQSAQLGSKRRLKIIFDVNMRMSYAAGRWEQIERVKSTRPYLRYVAILDSRTRPDHKDWHGLVLPVDDPFWNTHYPPNGWNCRCSVQSLSARDLERRGFEVSASPEIKTRVWKNARTGDAVRVPEGIDPGFGYNVGRANPRADAARLAMDKIGNLPADLGAKLAVLQANEIARAAASQEYRRWAEAVLENGDRRGENRHVGFIAPDVLKALDARGIKPQTAGLILEAKQIQHMMRDAKRDRGAAISKEELLALPAILEKPIAALIQKSNNRLVYVFQSSDDPRAGKIIVHVDYFLKKGQPFKGTINSIRTAGRVEWDNLSKTVNYELIWGELPD